MMNLYLTFSSNESRTLVPLYTSGWVLVVNLISRPTTQYEALVASNNLPYSEYSKMTVSVKLLILDWPLYIKIFFVDRTCVAASTPEAVLVVTTSLAVALLYQDRSHTICHVPSLIPFRANIDNIVQMNKNYICNKILFSTFNVHGK